MKFSLVLLMAGESNRFNDKHQKNKVLYKFNDIPLFFYSLMFFHNQSEISKILIVKNKSLKLKINIPGCDIDIINGGITRNDSLINAMKHIKTDYVIIHDGARIFFDEKLFLKMITKTETFSAVVYGKLVNDSVKSVNLNNIVEKTLDKLYLRTIYTPQIFRTALLNNCISKYKNSSSTKTIYDSSQLVEKFSNENIYVFSHHEYNFKLTYINDLQYIKNILKKSMYFDKINIKNYIKYLQLK